MAISVLSLIIQQYPFFKVIPVLRIIARRKMLLQGFKGIPTIFRKGDRYYYHQYTPGYPSEAFRRFFKVEIRKNYPSKRGSNGIQNVIFSVTPKCKLDCKHCFEWDLLSHTENLSYSELSSVLKKLYDQGVSVVQVSGGEPLERFYDCFSLAGEGCGYADFWLLTSGYGLDRYKAELLHYGGYTGVNISLDHWDPEEHNAFRGNQQSFKWVAEAAHNTIRAGMLLAFSLCARENFIREENLMKYLELAKEMKASFIQVLEPRKAGRYRDEEVALSASSLKLLSDFYNRVNNECSYRSYPSIIYHGHYQRSEGCLGAANRYFYIDSAGNAHACPFCRESAGNVFEEDMDTILFRLRERGCHAFRNYS
jgi:MoaA/NifB/PqqE/SkfB family radical SAM enzyme